MNKQNKYDTKESTVREYSMAEVFIINEISMVSNTKLLHIHKRLCEILGCSKEIAVAEKGFLTVINCNLLQLPPIRSSTVYAPYKSAFQDFLNLQRVFGMCE